MHGVPSSAARDARDEATSIHAAAAVATALAAAAEEGLEDDGRGDALHHIAEVCRCPAMHTCVHTHVSYTHGLAQTRRGDPAATHARAFMHAYDMRRNVMKCLRRWWCSRTLAGGAGALWPSAGGRRGVCYTGSSGSSHKVHARASSCSTPGQIQSCVCVSVCVCMYPWVALECRLTPKAKPHNNPSRTTPGTLSKQRSWHTNS